MRLVKGTLLLGSESFNQWAAGSSSAQLTTIED